MSNAPRKITFAIPRQASPRRCKSCDAQIVFVVTKTGKQLPINYAEGATVGESHFATCPQADMFRRST